MSATDPELAGLRAAARAELRDDILPFWERFAFTDDGFVVAEVTDTLEVYTDGPRHSVLVARILWTFASAASVEEDPALRARWLAVGRRALALLTGAFWDDLNGGVYWSLDNDGAPLADRKQVYAQAFAVYGLVAWHTATGDAAALDRAWRLFALLEQHSRDGQHGGYIEAHARDWSGLDHMALSPRDINSAKSMNTVLHVLEAYTALASASGDSRALESLAALLRTTLDHVVELAPPQGGAAWARTRLFFETDWTSLVPNISFGHDIEASWLLWKAAEAVGDPELSARTREATLALADAVLAHGTDQDGGVMYEGVGEAITQPQKEWWPQAEGVLGWLNAYALTGDARHRDAALRTWGFIERCVIDREHGEWFAVLGRDGVPLPQDPGSRKIGPWKCPYHNARACLEVMRRVSATGSVVP